MRRFLWTLCLLSSAIQSSAFAQVANPAPTRVPVSGVVRAPDGSPRSGEVLLAVSLYAEEADPAPLWVEYQRVTLADGRYQVVFGAMSEAGLPSHLFATEGGRWIGVAVENETEQPRMPLLRVPYAVNAAALDGRTAAEFVLTTQLQEGVKEALRAPDVRESLAPSALEASAPSTRDIAIASTTNALAKFADAVGTLADSSIVNAASGRVGIGTTNPALATLQVGDFVAGDNTDWSLYVARHGTAGTPGTWGAAPAITITDWANDGPGTLGQAPLLQILTPRLSSSDPNAVNARLLHIRNDNDSNLFSVNGRGDISAAGALTVNGGLTINSITRLGSATGGALIVKSTSTSAATLRPAVANGSLLISDDSEVATRGVTIVSGGYVGIGTGSPLTRLHVAGDVTVDGNIGAKWQDVAEWVDAAGPLEAGTVVVVDPARRNGVTQSEKAYDVRVAGAVSPQPGLILGEGGPGKVKVAQSGRVKVKVDARYGRIRAGDLLVTSPRAGYAMRSRPVPVNGIPLHRPGTVLGKALEPLAAGTGEILVLLTLQ